MRLLLGREPANEDEIEFHRNGYDRIEDLRRAFMQTHEAKALFGEVQVAAKSAAERRRYAIPPFLLRRPARPEVAWRFSEPSLDDPVSQLCTYEQMETPTYRALCARLGLDASGFQRKYWEFAFLLAVLEHKAMLRPGRRGLGFGTGSECLPSTLAKAGVEVVATDAPADLDFSRNWAASKQWSANVETLWHPQIVDRDAFFERVSFRPADMNAIPDDLRGFDFCWSACAFEHLGSIRAGLDFLHNSLDTLRPGGVSVHTTEFNLGSDDKTMETPAVVIFRRRDFELVIEELVAAGHRVEPLNLWPGATPTDEHIDLPPFSSPHLKLELGGYRTTSIGIVITKRVD